MTFENQDTYYMVVDYKDNTQEVITGTPALLDKKMKEIHSKHNWSSIHPAVPTKDAEYEKCVECGNLLFKGPFYKEVEEKLFRLRLCHTCNFWTEYMEKGKVDKNCIIIKGHHYYVVKDNDGKGFTGFGGREFKIKRFDSDAVIITHNLWSQGDINKHFLERMPDNAEFV